MRTRIAIALAGLLAVGCFERTLAPERPCTRAERGTSSWLGGTDEVDLLLVVDNSGSMGEEQASFTRGLWRALGALASGDLDGDGSAEVAPLRSLHVGVITTDMGVGGYRVPTCDRGTYGTMFGDDGVLLTRGRSEIAGCMADGYPRVFDFERDLTDLDRFATELECVATTGTVGCGFEQQLEAVLKALSPSLPTDWTAPGYEPPLFLAGTRGHADGANAALVRPSSVLAVVMLSDEEDCSVFEPEIFDVGTALYPGDLNLRCWMYEEETNHPIERYVRGESGRSGLIGLRQDPRRLVFGAIVGVPVEAIGSSYEEILAHPDMQNRLDPDAPTTAPRLRPSCNVPGVGISFPPRRIVRVAQGLEAAGARATVQSICQSSYAAALDEIVREIEAARGLGGCLSRELERDASGLAACELLERLPAGDDRSCSELPGREDAGTETVRDETRTVCRVLQVAAGSGEPGWIYETAESTAPGSEVRRLCGDDGQRVRLASGVIPAGSLRLVCRESIAPGDDGGAVGSRCDPAMDACLGGLSCDPAFRGCGVACTSSDDCAAAGLEGDVCDERSYAEVVGATAPDLDPAERDRRLAALVAAGITDPEHTQHGFCERLTCR